MTDWISYRAAIDMVARGMGLESVSYEKRTYITSLLYHAKERRIATTAAEWVWQVQGLERESILGADEWMQQARVTFLNDLYERSRSHAGQQEGEFYHTDPLTGTFELRFYKNGYGYSREVAAAILVAGLQFDRAGVAKYFGDGKQSATKTTEPRKRLPQSDLNNWIGSLTDQEIARGLDRLHKACQAAHQNNTVARQRVRDALNSERSRRIRAEA